jgi:hypothetical protein
LVFKESFQGEHHQPLDDAKNLMLLYRRVLDHQSIILEEYLKVFKQLRHVPEPVKQLLQKILNDQPVDKPMLIGLVKDYLG